MSKKYGLILPDKGASKPVFQASRNVFGSDSDSEDDKKRKPVLLRPSDNINRQAKIVQQKAVLEDPTVYQYDEVYDEIAGKRIEEKKKTKEDKKPRYIEKLLKTANKRKIENERRTERQVQKEREKEGDEFADKEIFVTSAYKKKLEEMRNEEENEKREEYLEKIGDVTKQQDLGGFYRHLFEQKLGPVKVAVKETDPSNKSEETPIPEKKSDSDSRKPKDDKKSKRNYRKRKGSANSAHLSEGEIIDSEDEVNRKNIEDWGKKKAKIPENIDADSDFSIDDSSSDEDTQHGMKVKKVEPSSTQETSEILASIGNKDTKDKENKSIKENKKDTDVTKTKKVEIIETQPKVKIDIWKKRTVGEVFEQALKRYYERKSARGY